MLNWLKRSLGGLLALCMLISLVPTALAADRSELEDHWASESLTYFADEGWLQGYKDGTYKPDSKISRAEFITILNRVCGFTERDDEAAKAFKDVKETDWYFEQVSIALAAGYTNGTSKTTMSPKAKITRQEAFTMIARVAGVSSEDLSVLDKFSDADTIGKFAKSSIAGLTAAGYVEGYKDGKLLPKRNISRAEAVKTMYSCLDLLTSRYVLMNIPYAEFYAAELQNDVAVDGVTSATLNKTRTPSLVGGSYHVNADGTDITGITFPVKVGKGVSLKEFTRVTDDNSVEITVTNRGNTSTTTLTGKDVLFESASYSYYVLSEAPAYYKEATLDKDGKLTFGKIQGEAKELTASATLSTSTSYGDYQVDVDLDDDTVKNMGNVYGVILSTKEGNDYGMRHLENVWRTTEIAWCTGFTTAVHNCPTSSEHYKAMMGQTISQITYITESGIYTIAADLYVPVKTGSKLEVATALASAKETTVTAELPEDYQAVYTVTTAKGEAVTGMEVKDGKLTWTEAAIGTYTLTVTDQSGKYAPLSASFELQTEAMPAEAAADNQSIVKNADASDADFAAFVAAISKVNVNGKDYAASGRGAVKVIKEDGTIDFTTTPFQAEAKDGKYVLTITATGYQKTLTVTVPATYYLYASLTYEEYWKGEGVYAADNTSSSEEVDSRGEYDKGGYDAVTRATSNHGLHRGSFQQDVTIHTESGKDYYPLYWIDANNFVDREDGQTYNKTEIGIKSYNITGIKYVPVAVRAQDYAQFVKDYEVTLNGEQMLGGYTERQLTGYDCVAEVTANTNGLKAATLTDGVWSFGARQTGTDSGIQGQALAAATDTVETVKPYSGQFGEFLRFDITGNDYGKLGSAMQTVKWIYYGSDSTYTTALQTYGTKFAADDWMHGSMGIQLGLTDSIRCQLPEGTDGTGYWTVTIYGLGYADYTAKFEVTAENLPTKVAPMTDEQKTQLTALKDQAGEILAKYDDETIKATPALAALKEHYDEAVALLANADATEPEAAELLTELPALIEAAKPQTQTYTGTATTKPDEDGDFEAYTLTATVTVEGGKITAVTAQGGGDDNAKYLGWAISGRTKGGKDYVGIPAQLIGKTVDEVTALSGIDAVSGATCSSTSILEAVQNALKNPAA